MNDDSVLLQWLIDHNDAWFLVKSKYTKTWSVEHRVQEIILTSDKDPRECIRKAMKVIEAMK